MFDIQIISETSRAVRDFSPLIHCITNNVTVNDCANILLAAGASPCMAEEVETAEEIASISAGVNLNVGTLLPGTLEAMIAASKRANSLGIPVTLDPVGVGASNYRNVAVDRLLENSQFTAICGNMSELKYLASGRNTTKGVDVAETDKISEDNYVENGLLIREYAQRQGVVAIASGYIDLISDGTRLFGIRNGSPMMGRITGSGCMRTTFVCAWLAANRMSPHPKSALEVAVAAISAYGVCGEIAAEKTRQKNGGIGTFRTELLDAVTLVEPETLSERARIEIIAS